jgi:hypothetical protein
MPNSRIDNPPRTASPEVCCQYLTCFAYAIPEEPHNSCKNGRRPVGRAVAY